MTITRFRPALLLALVLLVTACAATATNGVRRDSTLITAEELANAGTSNLYDAVNRLRPRWLTARAAGRLDMTEGGVFVYQGNTALGNAEVLRQMDVSSAYALRYLDAAEAQATLPGLRGRMVEGAIVIYRTEADMLR